jgi:hypothetical protein
MLHPVRPCGQLGDRRQKRSPKSVEQDYAFIVGLPVIEGGAQVRESSDESRLSIKSGSVLEPNVNVFDNPGGVDQSLLVLDRKVNKAICDIDEEATEKVKNLLLQPFAAMRVRPAECFGVAVSMCNFAQIP